MRCFQRDLKTNQMNINEKTTNPLKSFENITTNSKQIK